MSATGRPLRFLGLVVGGWVIFRLGAVAAPLLWEPVSVPGGKAIAMATKSRPMSLSLPESAAVAPISETKPGHQTPDGAAGATIVQNPLPPPSGSVADSPPTPPPIAVAVASTQPSPASAEHALAAPVTAPSPPVSLPRALAPSRWALTGWLLWRREGDPSLAQAPLLGGSQGGVRLDYHLWQAGDRSLNLYGRFTRALERPFADEGAVGLALRPVKGLPVAILAERRQRIGTGGRSGFALLAAGGIGPRPVGPHLEVEGYAQAGIVGLPGSEGFADGRLSIDYKLTGKPDLALGIAVSGAAQTGTSRLDIGPELRLRLPVAGGHVRLSAEWRQRIAGSARPSSGPAVALVTDF